MLSVAISLSSPSIARDEQFSCKVEVIEQGKNVPATIARAKRGNEISIIYWVSEYFSKSGDTPKQRCKDTSQKFQKYYDNGWLKYIRTDIVNNVGVICVAHSKGDKCNKTDTIVTLPPSVNRFEALRNLLDLRRIASSGPLYLSDQLISYQNGELYIDVDVFLKKLFTP